MRLLRHEPQVHPIAADALDAVHLFDAVRRPVRGTTPCGPDTMAVRTRPPPSRASARPINVESRPLGRRGRGSRRRRRGGRRLAPAHRRCRRRGGRQSVRERIARRRRAPAAAPPRRRDCSRRTAGTTGRRGAARRPQVTRPASTRLRRGRQQRPVPRAGHRRQQAHRQHGLGHASDHTWRPESAAPARSAVTRAVRSSSIEPRPTQRPRESRARIARAAQCRIRHPVTRDGSCRHSRSILLHASPGQAARRHPWPADDRARLPPRVRRPRRSSRVIVATDDLRVFEAVRAFGGEVMMTSPHHRTGSERVAEVAAQTRRRPRRQRPGR